MEQELSYQQGELQFEAPADLFIPTNPLQISLADFSGPLDILLYLIRKNKIEIENIDITKIAFQYEEYLKLMKQFNLQLAADYLVMAAILTEIKSISLLPEIEEEEQNHEDMRLALVKRIKEYERLHRLAVKIAELPRINRDFWTFQIGHRGKRVQEPKEVQPNQLYQAMTAVLARQKVSKSYEVQEEELSTEDRMVSMLDKLRRAKELKRNKGFISFESFLAFAEGRNGVAVTFISLLQLIKDKLIEVMQKGSYQRLFIRLNQPQLDEAQ